MKSPLLSELRNNPRLRWGLLAIVATCWLYGVLLLSEAVQAEAQRQRSLAQTVTRLQAQLGQTEWPARVAPAKTMAVQLESRLWQAPTPGLAQAAVQEWLAGSAAQAGIAKPQISVTVLVDTPTADTPAKGENVALPSGLRKISAKLSFDAAPQAALSLLNMIDSTPQLLNVTSLTLRKEPAPHVDLELITYFQKPNAAAPALASDTTQPGGKPATP
jgi:hypothetical protein